LGLVLIVIGLILWLLTSLNALGIILIVVGVILLFVPHTYGYSDWRGRRGPPP
jgi:membrane protein YdbS with pleckstrin-like domain